VNITYYGTPYYPLKPNTLPKFHEFERKRSQKYIASIQIFSKILDILLIHYVILPAALGLGVYSDSNKNEFQKQKNFFLGSRALPVPKADNLATICEPII
jgi:hypothetical protein